MTADEIITLEVASWPGVTAGAGSRGEFSFKVGKREIGHIHGDWVLHIGFPKDVWQELYDAGRIDYHSVFPGKKGWAARRIETSDDVQDVIALLRLNYDRAVATHGVPASEPVDEDRFAGRGTSAARLHHVGRTDHSSTDS